MNGITIIVVVLLIALAVLGIYYLRKMLKANDGKVPQEPCHTPEPVSYTHLDVYKRQLVSKGFSSLSLETN